MQFSLRTLLIAGTLGPPAIAVSYWFVRHVMGMEDWKIVVAVMDLIVGFYALRDAIASEDSSHDPN
jgi:hypothetical protein